MLLAMTLMLVANSLQVFAQQAPNPGFEDWSGEKFDGQVQPKDWYGSNISQMGINFNLTNQEAGHTGKYSLMVKDTEVGALGITELSPGYFSLGKPWSYIDGLNTNTATAGTSGGIKFTHRPDTMSVWIKRTGPRVTDEDFYLLYYAWSGTAKGDKYKAKDGSCASVSQTNEESDIRLALDANECGTVQKANQIAEGMWREKKEYGEWTNIRVPIYYFNNDVPTMMNMIFSASNYPNFRAKDGLYKDNALYVDDIELIYSSKIDKLYIGGKEWKGFDPNNQEEQTYSLGRSATAIPEIIAVRGAGSLTNARGTTVSFSGRQLSGNEIAITNGVIDGAPTVITITSEDGKSTSTYKIKFVREASKNAKLANIFVNDKAISNFQPSLYSYVVELPYGTTTIPVVSAEAQEDEQLIQITQPSNLNGTATIAVTAADKQTTATYNIQFKVALLADNTLKDIKINGNSIAGFNPNQTIYRVSLPVSTTTLPVVEAVSAYAEGEQTITHTAPATIDGGEYKISVTTPGNQVPKTYKLTFKLEASDYSLLKSLQMGDNLIPDFDPNRFIYYVNLPIGTTTLPQITYEKGEATQVVTVEEGGLDGVSKITVLAGNKINQSEYKISVTTAKSEISTLNKIYVGGEALADFAPNKTSYTYTLPIGTTQMPDITVEKGDEYQTVNILPGGINGTTRITVTAQNGATTIYQIAFSVNKATNATLKMIYLDGQPLSGFDANTLEYDCPLPKGTTELPVITYDQSDEYQTVTVRSGGINGDYKITVRPQSGASQTYVLHFSVATSDNVSLAMLYIDGKPLEGFRADSLEYTITLPMGVTTIPNVTYDKTEASQKVLNVCIDNVQNIKVTAENGKSQTYTITFIIQRSESAFLKMIYLDGVALNGFDKNTFDYTVALSSTTCPVITVDKEEGQTVTITTPYALGQAKIVVATESGDANTYTINFVEKENNFAWLNNIYVDGQAIAGFQPNQFTYSVVCKSDAEITYDAKENQVVTLFRQGNVVILYVVNGDYKAQYEVTLNAQANTDCTLRNILVDGTAIAGFAPSVFEYTLSVAGTRTITYEKQYAEQSVVAGYLNASTYSLLVRAQSGDTARYTLHLERQLDDDANLINLSLQGYEIGFQPTQYEYTVSLPEGYDLPNLSMQTKPGQTTAAHTVSDTEQQVIVIAPSGKTNIYRINYNRNKSTNAWLSDILINGASLAGFDANTFAYTDTLAWRTKVVPCVQPVGSHQDQTITTYHSAIDGITTIHVVAPDGTTYKDYTIHFPVIKSSNNKLLALDINDAIDYQFDPSITDYHVTMPYGTTATPVIFYEKAEAEQEIEYVAAPIDGTTKFIVTAENGEQLTYNITFTVLPSPAANVLKSIEVNGTPLDLTQGNNINVPLPYMTTEFNITYQKNFAEQTVSMIPGDVMHAAKIVVYSNRDGEEPTIYTINPQLTTYTPAVLTGITVNGTPINNFRPDQYNYIVNVDELPEIGYTAEESVAVEQTEADAKHVVYTVTNDTYTSVYTIYFYYQNDVIPGNNLTDFVPTVYNGKVKPNGWMVPADCAESYTWTFLKVTTGQEVTPLANGGVHLSTWRDGDANAIYGSVPGIMTIGTLSMKLASTGNSTSSVSGGITFRNTPDQIATEYRATAYTAMNNWRLWVNLGDGINTVQTLHEGSFEPLNQWQSMVKNLDYSGLGLIQQMNITVNSGHSDNAKDFGGITKRTAELDIRNLRFIYNSKIASVLVDDTEATIVNDSIFYHIEDPEYNQFPTLAITGEKTDQMPIVTWNNEVDGVRTVNIHNVAEDGSFTDYTLLITRTLSTENRLQTILVDGGAIADFAADNTTYTYTLPNGFSSLPSITAVPASTHQLIDIQYVGQEAHITVTPEAGDVRQYTIKFVEAKSNSTLLAGITATGITFDPNVREYHIQANELPEITFVKLSDGQTVTLNQGILTVLAEDGTTTGNYSIILDKPTTTGKLADIEFDGISVQGFSSDIYEYSLQKPAKVAFKRAFDSDSVIFVQTPLYLEWQVIGDEQHTYRVTYSNGLSSSTYLKAIYVNAAPYQEFNEQIYDYTLHTDEPVQLHVVANDKASHLDMTKTVNGDSIIFTYVVTAEDGTVGQPYTITIAPALGDNPYLNGIYVDGKLIAGFKPEVLEYSYTIPAGLFKKAEPALPEVTYQLGAARQRVEIEYGTLGETTNLIVTSEDGSQQAIYQLYIDAEPSHCALLTGIAINGKPIEGFYSGLLYYSMQTSEKDIQLAWSSDDNFQQVEYLVEGNVYILRVTAQDGTTVNDYRITVFQEEVSSNATLTQILLNGLTLEQFQPELNTGLYFSPMQQRYNINLPTGTLYLPEVTARLNEEGQTVVINTNGWTVTLTVTAPDGITTNTYTLYFKVPMSSNAHLKMIYLDGDTLQGFLPEQYNYIIPLPMGQTDMPEVYAEPQENKQTVLDSITGELQHTIYVTAEDGTVQQYFLAFQFNPSQADTLMAIYADGELINGFRPDSFYYSYTLPVGTTQLPDITWDEADKYQTINPQDIYTNEDSKITQIQVVAQSGSKNTYTVVYTIEQSAVDTLQMIYIQSDSLEGFDAFTNDYYLYLAPGDSVAPTVAWLEGDIYQTVQAELQPYMVANTPIGWKQVITVTAQSEAVRVYTIYFLYSYVASTNTNLQMIYLDGKELEGFNPEKYNYTYTLGEVQPMPSVLYEKADAKQTVTVETGDITRIVVTAEDPAFTATYTITFHRQMSPYSYLEGIYQDGVLIEGFRPDSFLYDIVLPYGTVEHPTFTYDLGKEGQTVTTDTFRVEMDERTQTTYRFAVTAPDPMFSSEYDVRVIVAFNDNCLLQSILAKGELLEGFHPDTTNYVITYPIGTDSTELLTLADIEAIAQDPNATVTITANGVNFIIQVDAQDGEHSRVYTIEQVILLSDNARLQAIYIDSVLIRDFDPDQLEYTYYLLNDARPAIEAIPENPDAEVVESMFAINEPFYIYVTAPDGTERVYTIYFMATTIQSSQSASANDVLVKRLPGTMDLVFATLRKNVSVVVYTGEGQLLFTSKVEETNQNDAYIATDLNGVEKLIDVYTYTTVFTVPEANMPYIYAFIENDERRIASGKLLLTK